MRFFTNRGPGFTLIELLIVVAIIAILALIAVPNFLEAQTRAKVSRTKADMRSLAVAEDSYYIDWNSYTNSNTEAENPDAGATDDPHTSFAGFGQLTSPIAYITSIPRDTFGRSRFAATAGGWRPAYFALGTGDAGSREPAGPPDDVLAGMPSNCYEIESDGPDHYDDTRNEGALQLSTGDFPWRTIPVNTIPPRVVALLYDPTNGTVSGGEIIRFGGTKPAGPAYDYLWGNAVK